MDIKFFFNISIPKEASGIMKNFDDIGAEVVGEREWNEALNCWDMSVSISTNTVDDDCEEYWDEFAGEMEEQLTRAGCVYVEYVGME